MKVEILKTFKDKVTGDKRLPGQTIEVTEDRLADILSAGPFVKVLEPEKEEDTLDDLSVSELKKIALEKEIDLSGATKKAEILERIRG